MAKKRVTLTIDGDLRAFVKAKAKVEHRSISNMINHLVRQWAVEMRKARSERAA